MEPDEGLTVQEAARIAGVSVRTMRQRIKDGLVTYRKVETPRGEAYRIWLDAPVASVEAPAPVIATVETATVEAEVPLSAVESATVEVLRDVIDALRTEIQTVRAENKSLQDERAELYGRVGFLQGRIEEMKALPAGPTDPAPEEPPRSRWRSFLDWIRSPD